jgi:serine/threonine protein kinase
MDDPLIGQQLANFRVERVLGRGGMAQVYYGQDIKLERPVAIKVIDARYRDKPAYARRFVNEARVLAKWHHQHIVQIYYADDEDGLYYYVMEYIDGQNLATIIDSYAVDGELMPVEDVLHIARAVADALDYAHQQGVIHRDIKPSNILVARDGRVVLGDFGLAMDLQDGSLGETFGTPHYISPEQASRSANAVPQSDLYSLGVILYEILVGVVPFNDPSPTSVALQHITEPPPAPRSLNPDLTEQVETVLLKALEKSPQDRYQSGTELIAALSAALKEKIPKNRPPLPPMPAGVPTILSRRALSKESVTKRVAASPAARYAAFQEPPASDEQKRIRIRPAKSKGRAKKRFSGIWFLFFSFLFLVTLGFAWTQGWFRPGAFSAIIPLQLAEPTVVLPQPTDVPPKPTNSSSPTPVSVASALIASTDLPQGPASSATVTPVLPLSTATPQPLPTDSYTPAATNTRPVTPTVTPITGPSLPAEKNPDGHLFKLYYDENSLYLHNLSNVTRSISGFTFERVDEQDKRLNFFGGWDWGVYFGKITPNRCMAIELYESPPFLKPPECKEPYLSLLNPPRESSKTFWTSSENSSQFRVLWLGQEVARCPVGDGTCEFRVP